EKREWADRFSPPGSNLPLLVERNVAVEKATQRTSLMDCWGLLRNTMGFLESPSYRGGPNEVKETQLMFDPAKVEDSRFADPASRDYRLQSDSPHRGKTVGAFEYGGGVFFVKPDGDDAAEGTSVATAWKDASVAAARLKPGQTLYVLPGRYAASATLRLGSPPIQLRKRGVGEVVFDGRGKAACALDVDGEGELQIRGLRFVGYGEAAVRSQKGVRLAIRECVFDRNAGNAVAADGSARIEKSVFCGSKAAAIRAGAGLLQVYGCVFWRNAVAFDAAQPLLSNFNCFDGKVAPHAAELAAWQRASGQDSESIAADPQFANPSDGHFALAKSSPCWGRGYGWSPMGVGETPHHWFDSAAELKFEDVRASLVTPTMANLTWRVVGGQATALVRYGESRDQLDRVIARTTGQHLASVHAVTLFDLRPGATYHFQVGRAPYQMLYADNVEEPMDASPTVWDSAVHSFKTPTTFTPKRRTLHVSKAKGNDANDGFSAATAFASLHKAATVAEPGDRVVIGAGEYFGVLRPVHSGTPDAPIVFEAAPGERVELSGKRLTEPRGALLLDKRHIVLRGFVFKEQCKMLQDDVGGGAQLMIGDSRDITVEDCLFDGRMYYMAAAWVFRSGDIRFRHNVIYNASNYTALILGLNDGPLVFERNAFYSGGTSFGHVMGNAEVVFLNNIFGEKIRVKWGQPKFWLADTGKLVLDYNYYAFDDANQDRYALQVRPKRDSTPVESRGADPLAAARALGLERNGRVGPLPWANADRIAQKSATVRGVEPRLQNLQPLELGDFALKPDAACHGMASDGGAPGRR
ncbi:MAG: hypothetical protein FJ279_12085, partial [Planctomycetes bacterium]|nr:hypothetical protein [Planctomycetota bacterium]